MRRTSTAAFLTVTALLFALPASGQSTGGAANSAAAQKEAARLKAQQLKEEKKKQEEARKKEEELQKRREERDKKAQESAAARASAQAASNPPPSSAAPPTSAAPPASAAPPTSAAPPSSAAPASSAAFKAPAPPVDDPSAPPELQELRKTRPDRRKATVESLKKRWGDLTVNDKAVEELKLHGARVAYLQRIRVLAEKDKKQKLVVSVDELLTAEEKRHGNAMNALRGGAQ